MKKNNYYLIAALILMISGVLAMEERAKPYHTRNGWRFYKLKQLDEKTQKNLKKFQQDFPERIDTGREFTSKDVLCSVSDRSGSKINADKLLGEENKMPENGLWLVYQADRFAAFYYCLVKYDSNEYSYHEIDVDHPPEKLVRKIARKKPQNLYLFSYYYTRKLNKHLKELQKKLAGGEIYAKTFAVMKPKKDDINFYTPEEIVAWNQDYRGRSNLPGAYITTIGKAICCANFAVNLKTGQVVLSYDELKNVDMSLIINDGQWNLYLEDTNTDRGNCKSDFCHDNNRSLPTNVKLAHTFVAGEHKLIKANEIEKDVVYHSGDILGGVVITSWSKDWSKCAVFFKSTKCDKETIIKYSTSPLLSIENDIGIKIILTSTYNSNHLDEVKEILTVCGLDYLLDVKHASKGVYLEYENSYFHTIHRYYLKRNSGNFKNYGKPFEKWLADYYTPANATVYVQQARYQNPHKKDTIQYYQGVMLVS